MEDGLSLSDRVILVCTENYVRKADAGEGGVAYERMIVTAELVRNLGTQKFIPVIRQDKEHRLLPKFLGARFYVNLSSNQDVEAEYDKLLRELHKQPATKKPPLGKNPFAQQPSGKETPEGKEAPRSLAELSAQNREPSDIYDTALDIARQGDIVAWRKLVKDIRSRLPGSLQKWRDNRGLNSARDKNRLPPIIDEAVALYAPLFVVALAGVQSGRDKFRDQRSVIDELINPHGWVGSGNSAIVDIPMGLVFIFQGLYGAACLDTDQLDQAIQLGLMRIPTWHGSEASALIQSPHLIGWPDSLGGTCTVAWDFLFKAADRWPWVSHIFSLAEDYQVSLSAYYMALSILELADTIATGKAEMLKQEIHLFVPVSFLHDSNEIPRKAYRLLLRSDPIQIWKSMNVSDNDIAEAWPLWIQHTGRWLSNVYKLHFRAAIVHENLMKDVQ